MRSRQAVIILLACVLIMVSLWLMIQPRKDTHQTFLIGTVQLGAVDLLTLDGLIQGMNELGYKEGTNIIYRRSGAAGTVNRLNRIIEEHVAANVGLFFVSSSPGTLAVKTVAEKLKIPTVFAPVNDPISAGIVTDLQHPGGQLTGVRLPPGDDLRMQWFLRTVPHIKRLYFPFNPNDPSSQASLQQARQSSVKLGLELVTQAFENRKDIVHILRNIPDDIDAMFLARDSTIDSEIAQFVEAATRLRIPLCASSLTGVRQGALMSYGFDHREIGRQAAHLADQILRGVPAGDLPVETASNYLGINLDAASAIGIVIPSLILREAHLKIYKTNKQ